jgi:outer membrane protein assembly factor BamC
VIHLVRQVTSGVALFRLSILGLAVVLTACSSLEGDKVNYRSATKAPTLEVPPDLTQLSANSRYVVPGSAVTASGYKDTQANQAVVAVAAQAMGDAHIERIGNRQWLVVNRKPEVLWEAVRDFWTQSGFALTTDQMTLGLMETDWAENRAKLPQDLIRSTLGKVFDALYSTGEQDRFRTRFERNASGGTDIFISHRGMIEVYTSQQKEKTVWQPRPADADLEAEFLKRLMMRLSGTAESSKTATLGTTDVIVAAAARATLLNNHPVVQLDDGFDRAWRRVGLSLDRTGFTVEDRDRAKGIYFVRYVESDPKKKEEPGFLAKLLGSAKPPAPPMKLRVVLSNSANGPTLVSVLNASGAQETSPVSQRIVDLLAEDLR